MPRWPSKDERIPSITKSGLKERGWTEKLIFDFLGEPDLHRPNPHSRNAPDMCLYHLSRVEEAESSPQFEFAKEKARSRQAAARSGVETKVRKMMESISDVSFDVPAMSKERLIRKACDSFNEWNFERECVEQATPSSDPEFLQRICVNKLRHEMSDYDHEVDGVAGRVGVTEAYVEIRKRVLDEIARKHPWLAQECERQKI